MEKLLIHLTFLLAILLFACDSEETESFGIDKPKTTDGRKWDNGKYFGYMSSSYNDPDATYAFNVIGDSVILNFSGNGYIWKTEYKNDTIFYNGANYENLNTNPVQKGFLRNRITSPGFVFDNNDTTFLSYSNYRKISGSDGKIEGVYRQFLVDYFQNTEDSELFTIIVLNSELNITSIQDSDSLLFEVIDLVYPGEGFTKKISKDEITNNSLFLVSYEGFDYLVTNRQSRFLTSGFYVYKK